MKCFILLVTLAAVAWADATAPHRECGPNEEWKLCVSSSCAETTCEKRTIGPECTFDCQQGCYCTHGFHRNAQGNCVPEDQCPPTTET